MTTDVDRPLRPLTEAERRVLAYLLDVNEPGAAALRAQLDSARTPGYRAETAEFDLVVTGDVPLDTTGEALFPTRTFVWEGDVPQGELLLWIRDGRMSCLEYGWISDDQPTDLPDPALLSHDPNPPAAG
ncbi:hypothetical protein Aph02nite_57060 [Actinoplanes philippinensis]|uniref:Uncharacterized protein n=1 Tax=Actinoplanes philippinensis TaxID=35752 RepID=A0A1I2IZN1_9ACTN|nr:hypothetical protein [Actinoplanes philippinensis]GIE79756.1 hypothetical protein Aph02nite_57060 [Actinoplanes philippinensis]SFF47744.1 hypothetical protein SAMN05421541_11195 [Actinoplanes philippinensis]